MYIYIILRQRARISRCRCRTAPLSLLLILLPNLLLRNAGDLEAARAHLSMSMPDGAFLEQRRSARSHTLVA